MRVTAIDSAQHRHLSFVVHSKLNALPDQEQPNDAAPRELAPLLLWIADVDEEPPES